MIVWVRNFMESWAARIFFALLVAMFVLWGISNVFNLPTGNGAVAVVGGKAVSLDAVQADYQRLLNQAQQQGQQPDKMQRQQIAMQALDNVVRSQVLRQAATDYGIGTPNAAVKQVLDGIPAFQDNGVFSAAKFSQVVQNNNLSEMEFIAQIRDQLISQQLLAPIFTGAAAPKSMVTQIFALLSAQRVADSVSISTSAQPLPAAPSDAVLQRFWQNHASLFTAPEYRKIQVVILSPALLAPQEQVPASQIDAGLTQAAANPATPPTRSADVLLVQDLSDLSHLQKIWQQGASWAHMQQLASHYNAQALPLAPMSKDQIPVPALADALFNAQAGEVVGPVAGTNGMYLFKVTGIYPTPSQIRAQVVQALQLQMAQADVAKNVDALQDALAGQTPLNQLPGNLGLVAVEGTLDANGMTPDGTPAPLPGGDDLRNSIIKAAFAASKGQSAQLQNGPNGSYYALSVEDVISPSLTPFAQIKARVLSVWQHVQQAREAEVIAANMMHAINTGTSFAQAAKAAGLSITQSQGYTRQAQPQDKPANFVPVLFSLKTGEATMLSNKNGFLVAQFTNIIHPTPQSNPDLYTQLQQSLDKSEQDDLGSAFLEGLQDKYKVRVNEKLLMQIYQ